MFQVKTFLWRFGCIAALGFVFLGSVQSAEAKEVTTKVGSGKISTKNGKATVNKTKKTVTLKKSGTYTISGNVGTYRVVMSASNLNVTLVINNVTASHKTTSCICNSNSSSTLTVNLAKGSVNQLTGPSKFAFAAKKTKPDAVLYSEGNLKIAGKGKLIVKDSSSNGDAIGSGKVITMTGGTLQCTSNASDLQAKSITISGGTLHGTSKDTAIKAAEKVSITGGTCDITAIDKGIQGKTGVTIKKGTIRIKTSHSTDKRFEDFRGITAGVSGKNGKTPVAGSITITGGTIHINSYGDCIHAANNVTISGGNFLLVSTADDGIQAKAALTITGTAKFSVKAKGKKTKGGTKNIAANIKI